MYSVLECPFRGESFVADSRDPVADVILRGEGGVEGSGKEEHERMRKRQSEQGGEMGGRSV